MTAKVVPTRGGAKPVPRAMTKEEKKVIFASRLGTVLRGGNMGATLQIDSEMETKRRHWV